MVQLPSMGKRQHAEPAEPVMAPPPPAAAVKLEVEELGDDEHGSLNKRAKAAQPPPSPPRQQDMYHNVLDEPSPLGLRLRKSPSLLDLIQMRLSQANSNAGQSSTDNCGAEPPKKKDIKPSTSAAGERLKASNFPANILRIGTWEYISRYEGDLVAKCYFAKHKLVWEVLEGGLKSKIEIQWSDITALKVTCPENGQGSLDVVLARPPLFFKETDPQPRKHTLWQATSDFTGGQASMNRRHFLQCPSTLLSKNFEKLVQCDQRLNQLSQQADIILDSPVFEPRCSIFEDPVELKCHGFANLKDEHEDLPGFSGSVSPCAGSSMSAKNEANGSFGKQPEFLAQTINPGKSKSMTANTSLLRSCASWLPCCTACRTEVSIPCLYADNLVHGVLQIFSRLPISCITIFFLISLIIIRVICQLYMFQTSVVLLLLKRKLQGLSHEKSRLIFLILWVFDLPGASAVNVQTVSRNVNGATQEFNIPNWWSQLKVPGLRPSMSVDDLVSHLGNCINEQITSGNPSLANDEVPTKESLEEIAQYLLGDTQGPQAPASDEWSLMARVDSLCCLLQKDAAPNANTKPKPEPNNSDSIGGEDSEGSDEEFSSASTRKTTDASQPPAMSRKDSSGELLMNLPRIASIPQFLLKIPEDSEN